MAQRHGILSERISKISVGKRIPKAPRWSWYSIAAKLGKSLFGVSYVVYRSGSSSLGLRYSHALFAPAIEFEVTADSEQEVMVSRNSHPHCGHFEHFGSPDNGAPYGDGVQS